MLLSRQLYSPSTYWLLGRPALGVGVNEKPISPAFETEFVSYTPFPIGAPGGGRPLVGRHSQRFDQQWRVGAVERRVAEH
jgi:hypothetical protein